MKFICINYFENNLLMIFSFESMYLEIIKEILEIIRFSSTSEFIINVFIYTAQ